MRDETDDVARCSECGLPSDPEYGDPHECPPGFGSGRTPYDALVAWDQKTCDAFPTQWEGQLASGEYFYFRFRWGTAMLSFSEVNVLSAVLSPNAVSARVGSDSLAGELTDDQYRAVFVALHAQRQYRPEAAR